MQQKGMPVGEQRGRYGARCFRVITAFLLGGVLSAGGFARELPDQGPLPGILAGTAGYCERLKSRVFHFFCEEKVLEEVEKSIRYPSSKTGMKNFFGKMGRSSGTPTGSAGTSQKMSRIYTDLDRNREIEAYRSFGRTGKQSILSDYQIIQDGNGLREQRIPLEVNGRKVSRDTAMPSRVLYSYGNATVPVMLFAAEVQPSCRYTLLGRKKVAGRSCFVVTVARLEKDGGEDLARAWIDRKDFSIVQCEVFPPAIEGYDALLRLDRDQMSNLEISDVHQYGVLHEGLRFPSRTEILLSYNNEPKNAISGNANSKPRMGGLIYTRAKTVITHKKYRFFQVGTSQPVFLDLEED